MFRWWSGRKPGMNGTSGQCEHTVYSANAITYTRSKYQSMFNKFHKDLKTQNSWPFTPVFPPFLWLTMAVSNLPGMILLYLSCLAGLQWIELTTMSARGWALNGSWEMYLMWWKVEIFWNGICNWEARSSTCHLSNCGNWRWMTKQERAASKCKAP